MAKKTLHSVCRWTFHSGRGGFVPGDMRPTWAASKFSSVDMVKLVSGKIRSRLPETVELGVELHYDNEVNESSAKALADAIRDEGLYLAMITPGAHAHYGYGGIASLDAAERESAEHFGFRTNDLAFRPP